MDVYFLLRFISIEIYFNFSRTSNLEMKMKVNRALALSWKFQTQLQLGELNHHNFGTSISCNWVSSFTYQGKFGTARFWVREHMIQWGNKLRLNCRLRFQTQFSRRNVYWPVSFVSFQQRLKKIDYNCIALKIDKLLIL